MKRKLHIAYTEKYLDWQLGEGHPTNPERARIAVDILKDIVPANELVMFRPNTGKWTAESALKNLSMVHSKSYIELVLEQGRSGEWAGSRSDLAETAVTMFRGTQGLVHGMLAQPKGERGVYFNPQGAKHHAQHSHSSGFCVFNDMAWAAKFMATQGMRVSYLDWDAHHGDGVEALLLDVPGTSTHSIHDATIFPGTGRAGSPVHVDAWNYPLPAGSGDHELLHSVTTALDRMQVWEKPDVLLLACGADGLAGDPLSTLKYTQAGIASAATLVGEFARNLDIPVIIGGAGGYQPLDETPEAWATTVAIIHSLVR